MELLSTWGVIKASGLTAYLFMFLAVILGAFSYGKQLPLAMKLRTLPMHQTAGRLGFLFGLLHGCVLLIDNYRTFHWTEVFIPFMAKSDPIWNGIGTLALYVMLFNLVTSDWLKLFGKRIWRYIHLLAFPGFTAALFHGWMVGSNSDERWAQNVYLITSMMFIMVILYRWIYIANVNTTKSQSATKKELQRE